jgi:hypothetical protein
LISIESNNHWPVYAHKGWCQGLQVQTVLGRGAGMATAGSTIPLKYRLNMIDKAQIGVRVYKFLYLSGVFFTLLENKYCGKDNKYY